MRTHRRHTRRHRGGGWFDGIQNSWNGLTQKTKGWWSRLGSSSSSSTLAPLPPPTTTTAFKPAPMPPAPMPSYSPAPAPMPAYSPAPAPMQPPMPMGATQGGRRKHKHKRCRRGGSYHTLSHAEQGSLAQHAATYDGAPTAQPQAWTGGRRRRRSHRRRKSHSRRHRH